MTSKKLPEPILGDRFVQALRWATEIHGPQTRKGGTIPYLGHLLGVCGLVLDAGGDEDQAIAALLHDSVEDAGITFDEIESRFDPRVARIVQSCTDDRGEGPSRDMTEAEKRTDSLRRKREFINKIRTEDPDVVLVSAADKLNNLLAILQDFDDLEREDWNRFNVGRTGQVWYYDSLAKSFAAHPSQNKLCGQLSMLVEQIKDATGLSDLDLTQWYDKESQKLRTEL